MSIVGLWLLLIILRSMIRTALMNRHYRDFFAEVTSRAVLTVVRRLGSRGHATPTHLVLLWFFPAYILSLITVYFIGALTAFGFLYWGTRAVSSWQQAFIASGSALDTLGFATPPTLIGQWLSIPEGALGLGIVVFLFTFIPSYQAVIRLREDRTSWLYIRTEDQPTGVRLLEWCQRTGALDNMRDVWKAWEDWFRMLCDTHSVLPMLSVSPSVQSDQSWVLAAGAVLDAAALSASSIQSRDAEAARICVQTGTRALLAIADALGQVGRDDRQERPHPSRESYENARDRLSSAGIPLRSAADPETQWQDFLSLRGSYEDALFFIGHRTFAPPLNSWSRTA
jgi:hypothetical protein